MTDDNNIVGAYCIYFANNRTLWQIVILEHRFFVTCTWMCISAWDFMLHFYIFMYNFVYIWVIIWLFCLHLSSGSPRRVICAASWLCSQPNWHWSYPWAVGENRWCHSRKEPYSIFWCCIPGIDVGNQAVNFIFNFYFFPVETETFEGNF